MNPQLPILQPIDTYDYSPTPSPIINNNLIPSDKALSLQNLTSQSTGSGEKTFRADQSGIWLGGSKFVDAPFSVDMLGNVTIKDGKITIIDNNGTTILDAEGLISSTNFQFQSKGGGSFHTTNGSDTDITNMSLTTPNFSRPVNIIILFQGGVFGSQADGGAGSFGGEIDLACYVNGSPVALARMRASYDSTVPTANSDITTISSHDILLLPAGISTIKLTLKADSLAPFNNFQANVIDTKLSYIVLGS